jgi:hypothetical protein
MRMAPGVCEAGRYSLGGKVPRACGDVSVTRGARIH